MNRVPLPETRRSCNQGGCVVVEDLGEVVIIRDSKNPYQPGLVFGAAEYAEHRRRIIDGELERVKRELFGI
ncbi:DUF397 domain-containing protein [Actinomadura chibensis]|uniref:DUF397 domain-containing protein n=1 Tax=Actinomadura chibensis TaxID=392828 RepID=A0A5D0NYL1_9ACTN|nr:DUF397 domain-containing protein [Actinomadura chibensis]TYB49803.1 DUF397 domain-containing protein [Actinomadura chibensis]